MQKLRISSKLFAVGGLEILTILSRNARAERKVKIKEQAKDLKKSLEETNSLVEKTLHPVDKHKVTPLRMVCCFRN
jgi:hypothetical protein